MPNTSSGHRPLPLWGSGAGHHNFVPVGPPYNHMLAPPPPVFTPRGRSAPHHHHNLCLSSATATCAFILKSPLKALVFLYLILCRYVFISYIENRCKCLACSSSFLFFIPSFYFSTESLTISQPVLVFTVLSIRTQGSEVIF